SRHDGVTLAGLTHASSVIALDRCSVAASGIVTFAFVPLKTRPGPNFPLAVQVVFATVPVCPFPDESATVVPAPSPNAYDATKPAITAGWVVPEATFE